MYLTDREVGPGKATLDIILCVFPESSFGLQDDLGGRCDIDVFDGLEFLPLGMLGISVVNKRFKSDFSQYVHRSGNNYSLYQLKGNKTPIKKYNG
jgi:hypothetical protein